MRLRFFSILALLILCLPALAEKVVIGKLGQALNDAKIYSRASMRAHVYYHVKAYEYLVLRESSYEGFYRVVLANGGMGYVPVADVARLPYDVTADENKPEEPTRRDNVELSSRSRAAIAAWSRNFEGTPYKWGGNNPTRGIDCSAFVKFLYGQIGLNLPRTAAQQAMVGTPITRLENLQAGDRLYFWSSKRGMIGHTGIYLGNGYFEHSSSGHHGVATDYLGQKKWLAILVAARR
jgi:cell wall-associated NlpC family hydrolase